MMQSIKMQMAESLNSQIPLTFYNRNILTIMPAAIRVFISYCHADKVWVHGNLLALLKAGNANPLIDIEHFQAGQALVGQMDTLQDQASQPSIISTNRGLFSQQSLST